MLLLLTLLAAAPPEGPVPVELHGRWRVTSEVADGVPTAEECYRGLRIEIDAGTFRLRDGEAVLECRAGVDATFREIAVTPKSGSRADRPFVGRYFVSDDLLTLCLPLGPGEPVPDLTSPPGKKRVRLTLKREP